MENRRLESAPFGGGRFVASDDGAVRVNYYITDHLGSTRVVFDAAKNVLDRINYYPFGGTWSDASTRYQHTGMENQSEFGLKANDHNARMNLYWSGRFNGIDPLCEQQPGTSPYVYCDNNPVRKIDRDGRKWKNAEDEEISSNIKKEAEGKIKANEKSLVKEEEKLKKATKENQKERIERRISELKSENTHLTNLVEGIDQITADQNTTYTYKTVSTTEKAVLEMDTDGTIILNNYGNLGNRAHETVHGIQHNNGLVVFKKPGTQAVFSDQAAKEIEAYKTQYAIDPLSMPKPINSIFGVTLNYLRNIDPIYSLAR